MKALLIVITKTPAGIHHTVTKLPLLETAERAAKEIRASGNHLATGLSVMAFAVPL